MKKKAAAPAKTTTQHAQHSPRINVPPGGIKIMEALRVLLQKKSFEAITTAEISRVAGANEALIYRYFKDKRGLLHKVLAEYTLEHLLQIESGVARVQGALNKLRALMKGTISFHKKNRVFSRILLLEVRNYPRYFESDAYDLVKQYARLIDEIVEDGVKNKDIRRDISKAHVKDIIVGSIEHACLGSVVFKREFDEELLAHNLTEMVIRGLINPGATSALAEDEARKLDNRTSESSTAWKAVPSVARLQVDLARCRLLRSRLPWLSQSCPASLCVGPSHQSLRCRYSRRNSPQPGADDPGMA